MGKQATTPARKYNNAKCSKCSHYWLKKTSETCTNPEVELYYGKKHKIDSMHLCDDYDPCDD